MTHDERMALLDKHVAELREHFDTVQIFCTLFIEEEGTPEHQHTARYNNGNGNWYARFGVVSQWIEMENQRARDEV